VAVENTVSDNELIQRWVNGDVYAYNEIVQRYKDRLTSFCFRILQDYELAVDVAQETLIRVYLKGNTFQGKVKFSTWLYKIATNLSINEINSRKRRKLLSFIGFFNQDGERDSLSADDFRDDNLLPDQVYEVKQIQKFVHDNLAKIPANYRIPLVLREIEGHSYEEIMAILNIPEGTVKSHLQSCLPETERKLPQREAKLARLY